MPDRSPTAAGFSTRLVVLRIVANLAVAIGIYLTGAGILGDFVSSEHEKLYDDPRGYHDYVEHFPFEEHSGAGPIAVVAGILLLFAIVKAGKQGACDFCPRGSDSAEQG